MRKNLQRLASFATFDLPLNVGYNQLLLRTIHNEQIAAIPRWNIDGTRRKLIAHYWYRHVLYHFLSIFGLALLVILPFNPYFNLLYLSVLCIMGAVSFGLVYFCIYLPLFSSAFIPQLETLVANFKAGHLVLSQTKCAKTQAKIPTLTIIHSVLMEMAGITRIACDDGSAKALNILSGVDTGSIKENLRRIYQPSKLTPKERAEVSKGIIAARSYFTKLNHAPAFEILDRLERKL